MFLVKIFTLILVWLLLSGKYDLFHVSIGILSAGAVAWSHRLLEEESPKLSSLFWPRFLAYLPWLLWRILLANIHTTALILNPRLPVQPHLIRYNTRLRSTEARTLLATSITLTPGTISSDIMGSTLTIHALDDESAGDLTSGRMEKMVGWVFGES
ncbi:MAG: Na+/H+ antiporter subunit E [Vicinamibacteria bacterium]|nr:Na+/H+ antiporter subunit E [Vicinamibacteria bacterium]